MSTQDIPLADAVNVVARLLRTHESRGVLESYNIAYSMLVPTSVAPPFYGAECHENEWVVTKNQDDAKAVVAFCGQAMAGGHLTAHMIAGALNRENLG